MSARSRPKGQARGLAQRALTGGEARCEVGLLLELLPEPELGREGTGTGGAAGSGGSGTWGPWQGQPLPQAHRPRPAAGG